MTLMKPLTPWIAVGALWLAAAQAQAAPAPVSTAPATASQEAPAPVIIHLAWDRVGQVA